MHFRNPQCQAKCKHQSLKCAPLLLTERNTALIELQTEKATRQKEADEVSGALHFRGHLGGTHKTYYLHPQQYFIVCDSF